MAAIDSKCKWRCRIRALMIKFAVIQMDLFHMMCYQLAKNGDEPVSEQKYRRRRSSSVLHRRQFDQRSEFDEKKKQKQKQLNPLERILKLKRLAPLYHKFFMYFYLAELTRYALIDLLSLETFQDYQLLDCFILGRFRFIGRTNKISSRVALVFMLLFGGYRILAFNILVPPFKFQCLEFLLYDKKRVVLEEMKSGTRETQSPIVSPVLSKADILRGYLASSHNESPNPVFYLKSPFHLVVNEMSPCKAKVNSNSDGWILRPNRTCKSWRSLDTFTQCALHLSIVALIIWLWMISKTIAGSIATDLGFELGYPVCASWIQRQQLAANLSQGPNHSTGLPYQSIYSAPAVIAGQMSIDDIPAIIPFSIVDLRFRNAYYTARILLDTITNQCWYIDFMFFAIAATYLIFISSFDVVLNAVEIDRKLSAIVIKLTQFRDVRRISREFMESLHDLDLGDAHYEGEIHLQLGVCGGQRKNRKSFEQREIDELSEEVATIQAILADHFSLVRSYSFFMSLAMLFILGTWCNYSLVMSIWMGSVHSVAVEFEFLVAEIGGTFFAILFFSGAAIARTLNYRLYSLIARAMALDDDNSATKMRWTNIMKFYSPKPKYCFTLLGFAEISSLFCLKFACWVLSAYIVLTKFFYTNREPSEFA